MAVAVLSNRADVYAVLDPPPASAAWDPQR